jgi:tRNA(Ile)-lysidine synthase
MLDTSLFPTNAKVLVAVSGGADSMALLLALHQSQFEIVAAHVNHGLRGQESDEDEAFVLQWCESQGIKADSRRVQLQDSSENTARTARYVALIEMAHQHNCALIATGHTADDVLETVLLNWLRGASIAGLGGIPPCRELENGLVLVRPLLHGTREETRAFCRANGWKWREDSSNESSIYTRNRVRQLLPQIAEAGNVSTSQLAKQTARAAQLWREDNDFLDELARGQLELLTLQSSGDLLILNGLRLAALSPALGRRVLRLAAQALNNAAREIGSEPIETARHHIAAAGRHAVWQWPGNISVEWTGAQSGNRVRLRVVRGVAAE